jgi:membrane protease YdiL (CAAX protease family)
LNNYKPSKFLLLTIIISWCFWIPTAISGLNAFSLPIVFLFFLGGLGPMISSLILTYTTLGTEGLKDLGKRLTQFKRIKGTHYLIIFLLIPGICFFAIVFETLIFNLGFQFKYTLELLISPISLIFLILFTFFFGPLPEEIGWRGYGLDSLQEKWNPLLATLILGGTWSVWHIPLFFIKGTYQNELGLWSVGFWIFFASPIVLSFLITWVYNDSHRSTLSAVLLHFMDNFSGQFFQPSVTAEFIRIITLFIITVLIITLWNQNINVQKK